MKVEVFDLSGNQKGNIELPAIFNYHFRPDLINRVFSAHQSNQKQPQGRDSLAGKRTTAESWGPGRGRSRVPRVKGAGTSIANSGAFINMAVGGHLAHPPRSEKRIFKKVNKKEKKIALYSAIAATSNPEIVKKRGHQIDTLNSPVIIFDDKIQTIKKTSDLIRILEMIGLKDELERARKKKIRSGKGKARGRKYKKRKGPLIVAFDNGIYKAARNIPGVDVTELRNISVDKLAPGGHPGRLTIWSESSIRALNQWM
ncbi:MAG: 50S ribosomal protein L4 [Promethearchaeota archaeon]